MNLAKVAALQALRELPRNMQNKIMKNAQIKPQHHVIAAGAYHSLRLKADGSVVGWGANASGQSENQDGHFVAIAAGDGHSLGLKADGSVVGWGDNYFGQAARKGGAFVAIAAGGGH